MKKKKLIGMSLLLAATGIMALVWISCRGVPDEEGGNSAALILNIKGAKDAPPGDDSEPMVFIKREESSSEPLLAEPPNEDIWIVRVALTNPQEVFLIYNYVLGTPARLTVAPGTKRVVDVEAYFIYGGPPMEGIFPATHYYTITDIGLRTLDLTEATTSLNVEIDASPTGGISGGSVYPYYFGSGIVGPWPQPGRPTTDAPLPLPGGTPSPPYCPYYNYNYTTFADPLWGLALPTIPTQIWAGGPGTGQLQISSVPLYRNYRILTHHALSQIYSSKTVYMSETNTPVDLIYTGWKEPWIVFDPSSLRLPHGQCAQVAILLYGGWGGTNNVRIDDDDTCRGSVYQGPGSWFYSFCAFISGSCVIGVIAEDCGHSEWGPNSASGRMQVQITGGGHTLPP